MTATVRRTRAAAATEPDTTPARHFARIIGIDLSLTSTGIAIINRYPDQWTPATKVYTVTGPELPKTATLEERDDRSQEVLRKVLFDDHGIGGIGGVGDLVVIEAPSLGITRASGAYVWDRAGLWWAVVHETIEGGAVVVTVAPATRAKWATGSGRSDKAAVAASMARRLGEIQFANSDEADASAMAYMGGQQLGWLPGTKAELDALRSVNWPKGVHA